jgi:hypothetical protein
MLDDSAEALSQLAFRGNHQLPAGGIQLLAAGLEGVGELLAAELELPPGEVGSEQEDHAGEALQQRGPSVVLQPEPVIPELHAVLTGDDILVEFPMISERRAQQAGER